MLATPEDHKKVLVVDDDPVSLKLIAHIFSTAGCEVKTAQDGIEALTILKSYVPDVIAIDLIMPYLKGDRLCQIIRDMDALQDVSLIIISGVAAEADLTPADYGADACLAKGEANFEQTLLNFLHQSRPAEFSSGSGKRTPGKHLSLRTSTKELLTAQYRLEIILQNMVDPLFELTQTGQIVYANQSAVALAGIPEYRLLGSDFIQLFSQNHAHQIQTALQMLDKTPVTIETESPAHLNGRLVAGWFVPFTVDDSQTIIVMLRDITARKKAERALERSRASFHDIVEKTTDGILVLDEQDHAVCYANPMAAAFLEKNIDQLIGRPFHLPSPTDGTVEIDIFRPDIGTHGIAEIRMVPSKWENRPAHLITFTDISPRKALEHRLKKAKKMAEKASQAKSEFLANMSHELRSPLNALLLLAQNLANNQTGNLTSEQIESAQLIHNSGSILHTLINEILDFTKIEMGRMDVYLTDTKLMDLAEHTLSLYRHMAEGKKLTLDVTIDDELPDAIQTDHQKLEQILRNLVSNAIKFTPQGGIRVHFRRPRKDDPLPPMLNPQYAIAIAVIDTGIGISTEKQENIFDAFSQADSSTARRYGGTGLGLSISKKLAHLLGGDIGVSSKEGGGSTFSIYLPNIPKASDNTSNRHWMPKDRDTDRHSSAICKPEGGTQASRVNYQVLEGKKVLVVDDEARNLFSIATILENRGLSVFKAINGKKAIAFLNSHPDMDMVLMDIMMPEMDGYETIGQIRKFKRFKKLPIIALTANAMKGDKERCMSAGADAYLSKPAAIDQILSTMAHLVERIIGKTFPESEGVERKT